MVRDTLCKDKGSWSSGVFSKNEVDEALFQMHLLKVSGPDGLPTLFFQKFWHVVWSDVKRMVLQILDQGADSTYFNQNFIVLIPKCKKPRSAKDFSPISLCNVVMNKVSKTIANRIKSLLPEIINIEQNAFVGGVG